MNSISDEPLPPRDYYDLRNIFEHPRLVVNPITKQIGVTREVTAYPEDPNFLIPKGNAYDVTNDFYKILIHLSGVGKDSKGSSVVLNDIETDAPAYEITVKKLS